jgi:23S rRNA (pseudouridine1915-N3)-methyltransferase
MLTLTLITVGNLKESYLRDAAAEYAKRLGAFCRFEEKQLKEQKLPENPAPSQIQAVLNAEGKQILAAMPPKSYKIALCVEGKQFSSEELACHLEDVCLSQSEICLVIGSSHGLSPEVKSACDLRLSVSKLTFPHQLMRVILLEAVYRAFNIIKGTRYHK